MKISNELKKRIEKAFILNEELRNQLLSGNEDAVHEIGIRSQKNIKPEDVIEAYENDCMDYVYKQAKKMVELKKLYNDLCDYYLEQDERE